MECDFTAIDHRNPPNLSVRLQECCNVSRGHIEEEDPRPGIIFSSDFDVRNCQDEPRHY
jgi:hypothetical protein